MKQTLTAFLGLILMLGGLAPSKAEDMYCGNEIIEGDQLHGMTQDAIRKKCGDPDAIIEGNWYYKRDQSKYRLHFNGNGELDSITEE